MDALWKLSNALVQLQALYNHCGVAASEKCLSVATFVRQPAQYIKAKALVGELRQNTPITLLNAGRGSGDGKAVIPNIIFHFALCVQVMTNQLTWTKGNNLDVFDIIVPVD